MLERAAHGTLNVHAESMAINRACSLPGTWAWSSMQSNSLAESRFWTDRAVHTSASLPWCVPSLRPRMQRLPNSMHNIRQHPHTGQHVEWMKQ